MKKALGSGLVFVLAFSACSSGDETPAHDAALPDVVKQADGPQTSPDGPPDAVPSADSTKDPAKPDVLNPDNAKPDVRAPDLAYPRDVAMDTSTVVDTAALPDGTRDERAPDKVEVKVLPVDGGFDGDLSIGFPCRDDSDCCTAVDSCQGKAYLYSKAPGAAAPPTIHEGDICVNCSPPGIQLHCTSGQCQGEVIPYTFYLDPLTLKHCGYIPVADSGISAKPDNPPMNDGTSDGAKTSWSCGDH
jgi:hypothetical protein